MSHQQAPIPQQGPQRWASRHSPPNGSNSTSSNGHSEGHSSNMSMSGSSSNGGAQYVDYPASPPQMAVRSPGPSTPFGMDDSTTTRLLAGQSQPSSPVPGDFASPLPHNALQMAQYGQHGQRAVPTRSGSGTASSGFASSPLNPSQLSSSAHSTSTISNPFNGNGRGPTSRPASRGSTKNPGLVNPNNFPMPSSPNYKSGGPGVPEDGVISSLGLGSNNSGFPPSMGQRGSMVLYRVADTPSRSASASGLSSLAAASAASAGRGSPDDPLLQPPRFGPGKRTSYASSSGDSIASLADSKYPATLGTGAMGSVRGLIPYAYDPAMDENEPFDEEDLLHDPNPNAYLNDRYRGTRKGALAAGKHSKLGPGASAGLGAAAAGGGGKGNIPVPAWEKKHFPWRGVFNVGVLVLLILGLLCLFVFYPVLTFYRDKARNLAIQGNIRINGTGQAPVLINLPDPIDKATPESAKTRTGFDGLPYELVFSDEFETPGRTFYPGDDPFWEAVDLWYGATADLEWYDPGQVTTRDGALVITMDSTSTTQAHLTPGSTAPFTEADNHLQTYRSGMVQTWNKFCFTSGYIEVSVVLPGPDQQTQGYWPGAWTMGNLGRPGYPATTDGMWPYTYDTCDLGTFPNQTYKDLSGPAAALHSDQSRAKNDFRLSWLSGQRLSACTCPNSDHPGPINNGVYTGRGAPEIDIFEAEKDKNFDVGHVMSQSAQFGPFSHDYLYSNDSNGWTNWDPSRTRANTFHGSAVQQSVSGLTRLPTDMFQGQGDGKNYRTVGFEYWGNPSDRENGIITWQVDGSKTHSVRATAVGPDPLPDGSGVGQRLIPEEPMSIVLNLGISNNWQTIDLSTMMFPAEFKIDYVRVYQRKGQTNVGCNPKDRPTTDYIANHLQAYTDVNMTSWPWEVPKNSLYEGGC